MPKFHLRIAIDVDFDFKPERYPAGTSPEMALSLELGQAASDPAEFAAIEGAAVSAMGEIERDLRAGRRIILEDNPKPRARSHVRDQQRRLRALP
jgi:hypothetical protein